MGCAGASATSNSNNSSDGAPRRIPAENHKENDPKRFLYGPFRAIVFPSDSTQQPTAMAAISDAAAQVTLMAMEELRKAHEALKLQVSEQKAVIEKLRAKNKGLEAKYRAKAKPENGKHKEEEKSDKKRKNEESSSKKKKDKGEKKHKKDDEKDKPKPRCGICKKPRYDGDHASCKAKRSAAKNAKAKEAAAKGGITPAPPPVLMEDISESSSSSSK
jgi:hypothetical protein